MTGLRAMLACSLVLAGTARAGGSGATSKAIESPAPSEPLARALQTLPPECRPYAWLPADARGDILGWNQLLSLASCLQETPRSPVRDSDELVAMLDTYARARVVPMMIYVAALESAPGPVQLRAAYQVAMLHVTLIVRARSSIVAPADLATNPDAARRHRQLHAELEELMAPSARIAWRSFAVIVRATDEEPGLARDPVAQHIVREAHRMLEILPRPVGEPDARELAGSAGNAGDAATPARDSAAARRPAGAPR